jgi:hypothetical protein
MDPVCCRETEFSGPTPIRTALLEPCMQGGLAATIVPAKVEHSPPVIVIW